MIEKAPLIVAGKSPKAETNVPAINTSRIEQVWGMSITDERPRQNDIDTIMDQEFKTAHNFNKDTDDLA